MPESKRAIGSNLAGLDATTDEEIARQIAEDPDTAPELTDEQLDQAELYKGDRFVRRGGRPKGSGKKELVTLRLDRDIVARFRAGGPGWQTRLNDTLRETAPAPARITRRRIPVAASASYTLQAQILEQALAEGVSIRELKRRSQAGAQPAGTRRCIRPGPLDRDRTKRGEGCVPLSCRR